MSLVQNIKFIAVIKENSTEAETYFCPDSSLQKSCLKEITGAFQQIKRIGLQYSERQRFNKDKNIWNCVKDSQHDIYYFLLTDNNYPERHAYGLLAKVEQEVQAQADLEDETISRCFMPLAKELYQKYDDLRSLDQMSAAQQTLDKTTAIMQQNVQKVLEGQKDVEGLSKAAEGMRANAFEFNKNSEELKKIMRMRNLKLTIIMVAMGVAIIGYILSSVL